MTNYGSNSYHVIDEVQETSAAFSTLPPESAPDNGDAVMKLWHTTELPDGQPVNVSVLFTADDIKSLQSFLNDQFGGRRAVSISGPGHEQAGQLANTGTFQPDVDLFTEQAAALQQDALRQCPVISNGVQCGRPENHGRTDGMTHYFPGQGLQIAGEPMTGDGAATPPAEAPTTMAIATAGEQQAAESATGAGTPTVAPSPSADEKPKRKRRTKVEKAYDDAVDAGDPHQIQVAREALQAKDPGNVRLTGVPVMDPEVAEVLSNNEPRTSGPSFAPEPPAEPHGQAWIGPSFAPAQAEVPAFQPGQTPQLGETAVSPEESAAAAAFPCPHQSSDGRTCVRPYGHEIQTENNPEPKPHVYATVPSQLGVTTAQVMQATEQVMPAFQATGHPAPTEPLSFQVPPTPQQAPAQAPSGADLQPPAPAAPFWQQPQGMSTRSKPAKCKGGMRHWFTWRGWVGSSAPTCQHPGCDETNPKYDPDRDPKRSDR